MVDTKRASVKMGNAKSVQKCGKAAHFCALYWYKIGKNARLFGISDFETCAFDSIFAGLIFATDFTDEVKVRRKNMAT